MDVVRAPRDDLDRIGAQAVANALTAAAAEKPHVILSVVGGRSVGAIYHRLADADTVPWRQVHVFVADERVAPLDSPESNWRQVRSDLLSRLVSTGRLPDANLHPFREAPGHHDHGVEAYDEEFATCGGQFDVVVLSAGEDGHVASLFPDHPSIRFDRAGYLLVRDAPKPPPLRISASRRTLAQAAAGVLLFLGESKRDALARFEDPGIDLERCPAKIVGSLAQSHVLTDLT